MRRWFLSYNSRDLAIAERLEEALKSRDPTGHVFFAPKILRAGGYWQPTLAEEIAQATAFVLLVGEHGLGPWQIIEYYEALDRRVKSPDFPLVLVLVEGQPAPGLPFLRQLHWIVCADPASEESLGQLLEGASGSGTRPGELWRHTCPYRGLAAMTEADSDFFFGREPEAVEVLEALAQTPNRLPLLVGNSGVGKSSLAQAGVLAALKRQAWPERASATAAWPHALGESRRWNVLRLVPGAEPLRALVEAFLQTWQLDPTRPLWVERRSEWIKTLLDGTSNLRDLFDATERRYEELNQPKPRAFFLYIDQGEELYARAETRQRDRFSEVVAHGLGDARLFGLMSLRADFLGQLQNDAALFAVHRQINVPPLRETELLEVVSRPAALLSARFETEGLPTDIARRTAKESAMDAGALPLLSYLLDDMWTRMVERGDGELRLPPQAMELGGVLVERANAFLARNPQAESLLRHVLTLKLATVRTDGEPTRRRAARSEFTDDEWRLACELADHPHRLLVTAAPEGQETYAEVAHEAIFRRWDRLREWMDAEREFLTWKSGLDAARHHWERAAEASKNDALLMGLALAQAHGWLATRGQDIPKRDREFIESSLQREALEQSKKERLQRSVAWLGAATLVFVTAFAIAFAVGFYNAEIAKQVATRIQAKYDILKAALMGSLPKFDRNVYGRPPAASAGAVKDFVTALVTDLKDTSAVLDSSYIESLLALGVNSKRIIWLDPNLKNNVNEVEAFRKMGFQVEQITSIPDVLQALTIAASGRNEINLIITHFGNNAAGTQSSQAYKLRRELQRVALNRFPVIIYSVMVTAEYACSAQRIGFYDETSRPAQLLEIAVRATQGDPAQSRCPK